MHNINLSEARHWGNAEYMPDGLVLTDSLDRELLSQGPVCMNFIVMALCKKGTARYTVDTRQQHVKPGVLMFISERHVVDNYEASPDFECLFILLSTEFYHSFVMNVKNVSSLLLFSMNNPVVSLTAHEMFYDMSNVIWRVEQNDNKTKKRADALFAQFISLLEENFRTERRVGWYAEQLGITAKYMSELIKQVSKRTPNEWIDSYVMLEIRVLLKNTTKSIKEIAEAVNFPNQSFFGKYFKEHMGMSPTEFRRQ